MASAFQPVELHNFPPFFTLQPVDASRAKQLEAWKSMLLSWCASSKTSTVQVQTWPYWANDRIQRRLSAEGITAVVEYCIATGSAEWLDSSKATLRIFYRSPAEWSSLIYDHCSRLGYLGQVLTIYELHSGTVGLGTAWEGLEPAVLLKAMEVLEGKRKATIMRAADVDETAVKLLP